MKKILISVISCLLFFAVKAQVKVGDNPTSIDVSAVLETESKTKGFLPPRMTQAQMNAIVSAADGLIVYCTDCNPRGLYNYDGSQPAWVSIGANNLPPATFTNGTIDCASGALSGTYQVGTTMGAGNSKVVKITVTSAGSYTASTNTQNGVTFSVSGTLLSVGAGTSITLKASGTPVSSGTFTYTASLGGQTCTFNVTYLASATFNCSGVTTTQTPTGALATNTVYSGTITIPYTAGNGTSYTTLAVGPVNGLSLTRVAGTYAAGGGNVVYNLSGTYTGANNGTVTFSGLEECPSSSFVFGDAIRGALAAGGCASCAAYDAAADNNWVQVTANEYNQLTTIVTGAAIGGATNTQMNTAVQHYGAAGSTFFNYNAPSLQSNNYMIGFSGRYASVATSDIKYVKTSATSNLNYANFGANSLPITSAVGSEVRLYWVMKRPSTQYTGTYLGHYAGGVGNFGTLNGGAVGSAAGNASQPTLGSPYTAQMQAITTATKQW